MLKILVPESEARGNSVPSGGWPRVGAFVAICAVVGAVIYGFVFAFDAPSSTPTRGVIPFAVAVVVVALVFSRRLPLSKPRVDLVYYSLAAMSAAILYVDNADQRATVQAELDRQRLAFLKATHRRQDGELARLRAASHRAAAEVAEAEGSLPALQQELLAAKRAAQTALDAIEREHDQMCVQVWRECPATPLRLERDGRGMGMAGTRLHDPLGCEARKNSCALGARSAETSALRSVLGSSRLEDLVGIYVGALPQTPLQTDRGAATLRTSVEHLVARAREMPTLRARRESTESALRATESDVDAQRRDIAQIETEQARQGGGATASPARSAPFRLEISFLANFVWGWVLVVLLGLKLAREPFVLVRRESGRREPSHRPA
jgi:hypothetical protein